MCGIFGWVLPSTRSESQAMLQRLSAMMSHRGPDGSGEWLGLTANQNTQVALGQRRLAIIDPEGGIQPMYSPDGRFVLITNGEIYNYIELREELRALGHRFHTDSDTEVLLVAYAQWGAAALSRLNGMFAFALWDNVEQALILARDAFGKKPLFVAEQPGGLFFSSEIAPLLAAPGVGRRIDPLALEQYLISRYVPGPSTFFKGIRKLPPGCYGIWRDGQFSVTRYFIPPCANTRPDIDSIDTAVAEFKRVFDDSVRIRLRSDVAYGAFLSGGIDSSAVVATMSKFCSEPVRTFSVGFSDEGLSELDYARTVAEAFGTAHREIVVTAHDFFDAWPTAVQYRGAPVSEASDIPIMLLSRLARQDVKMVLTGEGADEFLGGYPKHRAENWIASLQSTTPRFLRQMIISPASSLLPYSMRRAKLLLDVAGQADSAARIRLWFGGLDTEQRDKLLGRKSGESLTDILPFEPSVSLTPLRTLLLYDQTSWLPDNLLERGDRMMMAGSIEGRMPFMDVELAKLCARFTDRLLIGAPGGKRVLREAMKTVLTPQILTRKKVGFRVPIGGWFRGAHRSVVKDLLQSEASILRRSLNPVVIDGIVSRHIAGRSNNERSLWMLMNLEMFLRTFQVELPENEMSTYGKEPGS